MKGRTLLPARPILVSKDRLPVQRVRAMCAARRIPHSSPAQSAASFSDSRSSSRGDVRQPNRRRAIRLVRITRPDPAPRRPDLSHPPPSPWPSGPATCDMETPRSHSPTALKLFSIRTLPAVRKPVDLLQRLQRIDHHAVADHAGHVQKRRIPVGIKLKPVLHIPHLHLMPRVRSTIPQTHRQIKFRRQQIDDFYPFASSP